MNRIRGGLFSIFGPCGVCCFLLAGAIARGESIVPPEGGRCLESWSFSYEGWLSDRGYAPGSFTNLAVGLGDGTAVVVDSTNAAWLRYNVWEADGHSNLSVTNGSLLFWFAPGWSSAVAT